MRDKDITHLRYYFIVDNSRDKFSKLFDNAKIKIYQQSKACHSLKHSKLKYFYHVQRNK